MKEEPLSNCGPADNWFSARYSVLDHHTEALHHLAVLASASNVELAVCGATSGNGGRSMLEHSA